MKIKVRTFEELVKLNQQLSALEAGAALGDRGALREVKRIKKILLTSLVNTVQTKEGLKAIDDVMSVVVIRPKIKAMAHYQDAKDYAELGIYLAAALSTKDEVKMNKLVSEEGRDENGSLNFGNSAARNSEYVNNAIKIAEADGVQITRRNEGENE